jgi:hypothetical protein
MTDRLQKSNRTNLTDTRNVTFSQALEAGLTHYDYLDGRKTGRSGREAALVSHSVSPAKAKELKTSDTFGPLFDGLSPKNDLQQSLENRLRQAMDVNGCQEYVLTWKRWDMKSGPPICALRASGRRISGKGYSGWPTASSRDWKDTAGHGEQREQIRTAASGAGFWSNSIPIPCWINYRRAGYHQPRKTSGEGCRFLV